MLADVQKNLEDHVRKHKNNEHWHYVVLWLSPFERHFSVVPVWIEKKQGVFYDYKKAEILQGKEGALLVEACLTTGRLHWDSHRTPALQKALPQKSYFSWIEENNQKQRLHCRINGSLVIALPTAPLRYIDPVFHQCGEIQTDINPRMAGLLLSAPALKKESIQAIYHLIYKITSEKDMLRTLENHLEAQKADVIQEKNILNAYCHWTPCLEKPGFFDVDVGFNHQGRQINIPSLLKPFLEKTSWMDFPDDKPLHIPLPEEAGFPDASIALSVGTLKKMQTLFQDFYKDTSTASDRLEQKTFRFSKAHVASLQQFKETLGLKQLQWHGDVSPQQFAKQFLHFRRKMIDKSFSLKIPKGFLGQLRPYQTEGIVWLQFLKKMQLGGVLGDDMGLGKTLQALVHLWIEKKRPKKKEGLFSLILAPSSLLFNWVSEIEKFTPQLSVLLWQGSLRKKKMNPQDFNKHDIVITSYAVFLRDQALFNQHVYGTVILDEAQTIKNSQARIRHAVKSLKADQRFCLTGTPFENHLGELWSLFDFALPGLLGDKDKFRHFFREPIEKHQDPQRLDELKKRIAPFFLRRTKNEVLSELPPKIEITETLALSSYQQALYNTVCVALREKIAGVVQQKGIAGSQIYILNALLKLRQICCDPRLLYQEPSAEGKDKHKDNKDQEGNKHYAVKLAWLLERLPELMAEGRKILLFSQFARMLKLISQTLTEKKIPFLSLTGATPVKQRKSIIDQFQSASSSHKVALFLISLKAGGLGLNLTEADTVILYDPWWNPAVENQAMDRAHRIGQKNKVFVYKLMTLGTIEEKIIALQARKRKLFQETLQVSSDLPGVQHHPGPPDKTELLTLEDIHALFEPLG